jgi:Flp pilus assembly pilin Flp
VRLRRAFLAEEGGQVTVEWLMIAGLLTAIAVVIMGIVPATLIKIVQRIAMSLRTIAP